MEDPRKAAYEALEAAGLKDLKEQLKAWNEDTVRAKTEAIVERNKAADLLQEVMQKIDDEKKANEQPKEEPKMEPQAPQTDEQVKALLARVDEMTKALENEKNLRLETENKAKEQRIKAAYTEKLNLKPEMKELLLSNLLTQGVLNEVDGRIGMVDKAGILTPLEDHVKKLEADYAPYLVNIQGGKQQLPNAGGAPSTVDQAAQIKNDITAGTKGRVQIRNM